MSGYRFDRLKILVVDDNVHMRKLVVTILQAFGVIQIFEAESGERAWAVLRESNPDVVVLDWMMEGMSGPELTRKIRSDPMSPNQFVPVIMLTGYTSLDHVRQACSPFSASWMCMTPKAWRMVTTSLRICALSSTTRILSLSN